MVRFPPIKQFSRVHSLWLAMCIRLVSHTSSDIRSPKQMTNHNFTLLLRDTASFNSMQSVRFNWICSGRNKQIRFLFLFRHSSLLSVSLNNCNVYALHCQCSQCVDFPINSCVARKSSQICATFFRHFHRTMCSAH